MRTRIYFVFALLFAFFFSADVKAQTCTASPPATFSNNTPVNITDNTTVTSTIVVSGAPIFLADVNILTNITHTFAGDLDITITSPAGTVVNLTTDNGSGNDNVFNGTLWDDGAQSTNLPVFEYVFANNVVASPLTPEEPLGAFVGENPNGTWTISIGDDAGGDVGILASWSLTFRGYSPAPTTATTSGTNNTPVNITDNATVTRTITIAGAGTQIVDVNVLTSITHTFAGDLDITLTSPAGTVVTLTTDNGSGNDNVFNGTTWDDDAGTLNPPGGISEYTFANNVVVANLTPEEALAILIGENPNGTWTLSIGDDAGGDVGTLSSWSLNIVTSTCGGGSGPCAPTSAATFSNNTPVNITDNTTVTSTITVSGAPVYLTDVNILTNITHTFAGDLDITITSPAGTVVNLTTDNGSGNDNVFNGTLWDDGAQSTNLPVFEYVFANNVVASPLTPEEPLGAFIGENPNGTWTIRVGDDAGGDVGVMSSWSLTLRGYTTAPTTATTSGTNNTPVNITDNATVTRTITIAGAGTQIADVNVLTNITHTFAGDLDITLTSPAGTVVTLTTDNGSGNDNVFNGTTWDDDAGTLNPPGGISEYTFANNVVVANLTPEEALAILIGENPNGTWTLSIGDDAGGDVGTLSSWSLNIVTSTCNTSCTVTCPANITVTTVPGQCTAVVNYPAPTVVGSCGAVTATPASGSAFPVGTTTVNVSVAGGGPTCSFTVTVIDGRPPVITAQPTNDTVCEAGTAVFSVAANNAVSYQWQVNTGSGFVNIPGGGATSATLTLNNVLLTQNLYQYRVIVTGTCTSVTSTARTLYVNPLPTATIVASPLTQLQPNQVTTIYAQYNHQPGNFAWYLNGTTLVQNGTSPILPNLNVDDLGSYHLVYTDINGCIATTSAVVITADPSFEFWVYPNPNNGQFLIRFYSKVLGVKRTVRVWDAKGARVFQKEFTMNSNYERMDIDVSKYSPGVYYVELLDAAGNQLGTGSVIVRK